MDCTFGVDLFWAVDCSALSLQYEAAPSHGAQQQLNPCVSGQTSIHYADTGLMLCCFQQVDPMTDDRRWEYVCISGSPTEVLWEKGGKCCSGWNISKYTQNKPTSRPNWHRGWGVHGGGNKGMHLWVSGTEVSVGSVHWLSDHKAC